MAANIVGPSTLATAPLAEGAWLRPGVHLDLIGSFTPAMREVDAEAVRRARVFVDNPAVSERAGDLIEPLRDGVLRAEATTTLAALRRVERSVGGAAGASAADAGAASQRPGDEPRPDRLL